MAAESLLERRIRLYAYGHGCIFWKFTSPGTKGVPDRILVTPNGAVLFMEIKAKGKKPTKLQAHRMAELRANNVHAIWVDDFDQAKARIDGLLLSKT